MEKDRLGAFIDAVIAIIMTILVLELPAPSSFDVAGLWSLRSNFFAYMLSFFWLGAMWINLHSSFHYANRINQKTVWSAIIMLFFSSFYPYVTKLIAMEFMNTTIQAFYGLIVLFITFSVMFYYKMLVNANPDSKSLEALNLHRSKVMIFDVLIKIVGLILTLTVYPPAISFAILITLFLQIFLIQLKE